MSVINDYLRRMDRAGYNPRNRTKPKIVLGFIVFILIIMTLILEGLFIMTNTYTDFGSIMIDVVLFAAYYQVRIKNSIF